MGDFLKNLLGLGGEAEKQQAAPQPQQAAPVPRREYHRRHVDEHADINNDLERDVTHYEREIAKLEREISDLNGRVATLKREYDGLPAGSAAQAQKKREATPMLARIEKLKTQVARKRNSKMTLEGTIDNNNTIKEARLLSQAVAKSRDFQKSQLEEFDRNSVKSTLIDTRKLDSQIKSLDDMMTSFNPVDLEQQESHMGLAFDAFDAVEYAQPEPAVMVAPTTTNNTNTNSASSTGGSGSYTPTPQQRQRAVMTAPLQSHKPNNNNSNNQKGGPSDDDDFFS